jgi:ligand-binding sensor domain-containing protein
LIENNRFRTSQPRQAPERYMQTNHKTMKTKLIFLQVFLILSFFSLKAQENWTIYNSSNSDLTFNVISDIEFDSQGNKWVASGYNTGGAGIAKFDNNSWTIFNTNNSQGTSDVHKIEFSTGILESWVSVFATTIVHFSDGTETTIYSDHNYSTNILTVEIPLNATSFQLQYYIEDSSSVDMSFYNANTNNVIYQETFSGQMEFQYDYSFFTNIVTNQVMDISIDNSDNKWIATWQNGLIKYDDTNWFNYTISNSGLPNNNINCLATDSDNNVWIATSSGLTKFDGENWTTYNTSNSNLPTNSIVSIAVDNNDNIWLSTGFGLVEYTGIDWNVYVDNSELDGNGNTIGNWFGRANSLRIDNNGKKWMSAGYGIKSFDGTNWEYFNYLGSNNSCLLDCQTTSLAIDTNGDVWVGAHQECNNGGLLNFTQCNSYLTSNSDLPDNSILSLNIDNNGVKWVGTFNGLAKLETLPLSTDEYNEQKIIIYPNPTTTILNIQIESNTIGSQYILFDINGRSIQNGTLKDLLTSINVENLRNGTYFVKIVNNKNTKVMKFIR